MRYNKIINKINTCITVIKIPQTSRLHEKREGVLRRYKGNMMGAWDGKEGS
jgi:hypothetical protein